MVNRGGVVPGNRSVASLNGFFTTEKWVEDCTLPELRRRLGYGPHMFPHGVTVYKFRSLPSARQFQPRFYSNAMGAAELRSGTRPANIAESLRDYPPGWGAPQWEMIESLEAEVAQVISNETTPVRFMRYGPP